MQIDRDNEECHNVMRRFLPLVLPLLHLNHKQPENNYKSLTYPKGAKIISYQWLMYLCACIKKNYR